MYRNVARQLNITVASESIVSDAFLAVAAEIFSTGWSKLCVKIHTENSLGKLVSASGFRDVVHNYTKK